MSIVLEISAGPEAGRKLWLGEGQTIVVGRTEAAEFKVAGDAKMSSAHFRLGWSSDGFVIKDLKSSNGTWVNGERIEIARLKTGDAVLAGATRFLVQIEQPVAPATVTASTVLHSAAATSSPTPATSAAPTSVASGLVIAPPPDTSTSSVTPTIPSDSAGETPVPGDVTVKSIQVSDLPRRTDGGSKTIVLERPAGLALAEAVPSIGEDAGPTQLLAIDNRTPFAVGLLPWTNADGQGRLTVIIKATYQFREGVVRIAERGLPLLYTDEHEGDDPLQPVRFETDMLPFKPHADIVLVGTAYCPGRRPRPSVDVRLRVGTLQRRLRVFGNRRWLFPTRLAVVPQMTDPEPFIEMALSYTRAFGGIDEPAGRYCAENLTGIGFIGGPTPASIHGKPLPNIEDPEQLIQAWDTRPPLPAGFGFYGRGWQPRLKFVGTYDEAYRRQRFPLPPVDFSYEFHNGAHPALQVRGFLDGDELVELENLTRSGNERFALPGARVKITVTRTVSNAAAVRHTKGGGTSAPKKRERPVKPLLDTLVILPDRGLLYEVFRAVFPVPNADEPNVAQVRVE